MNERRTFSIKQAIETLAEIEQAVRDDSQEKSKKGLPYRGTSDRVRDAVIIYCAYVERE